MLEHLRGAAERCFLTALPAGPLVIGTTIVVETGGRVITARTEHPDDVAASCLEQAITARVFADPGRHARHRITHDFVLPRGARRGR